MNRRTFNASVIIAALMIAAAAGGAAAGSDYFLKGLEEARGGHLERAIQMWAKAIEKHPKSYSAHMNRGTAYMLTGHVFKGIMDWHKARELSPAFAYSVYTGPFIKEASGDTALLNFVTALELDPDHVAAVTMTGAALLDLGETEKAIELFRKSIDLTRNPLLKNQLEHWISAVESGAGK